MFVYSSTSLIVLRCLQQVVQLVSYHHKHNWWLYTVKKCYFSSILGPDFAVYFGETICHFHKFIGMICKVYLQWDLT